MKKNILLCLAVMVIPLNAWSSDQRLVSGAGTLKGGEMGISLDLGASLPEPLFTGVKFDAGLGDRFQLGTSLTTIFIATDFSLHAMLNALKSKDDSHFLSIYLVPTLMYVLDVWNEDSPNNSFFFLLQPGLAYEYRFGQEKTTGIYLKAGTANILAENHRGIIRIFGLEKGSTGIPVTLGFQHLFGSGSFAMSVEGMVMPIIKAPKQKVSGGMKIGLTWFL
jgi:hypothetical protein